MSREPLVILFSPILFSLVHSYALISPVKCGPHELFVPCMNRNEASCSNPEPSGYLECDGYCVCSLDYLRDDEGKCVPKEACPPSCPSNSVYEQCSKRYKQRCMKEKGEKVDASCRPGCSCLPGYYWQEDSNSCMKFKECVEASSDHSFLRIG